jgi:hypothetical protein
MKGGPQLPIQPAMIRERYSPIQMYEKVNVKFKDFFYFFVVYFVFVVVVVFYASFHEMLP